MQWKTSSRIQWVVRFFTRERSTLGYNSFWLSSNGVLFAHCRDLHAAERQKFFQLFMAVKCLGRHGLSRSVKRLFLNNMCSFESASTKKEMETRERSKKGQNGFVSQHWLSARVKNAFGGYRRASKWQELCFHGCVGVLREARSQSNALLRLFDNKKNQNAVLRSEPAKNCMQTKKPKKHQLQRKKQLVRKSLEMLNVMKNKMVWSGYRSQFESGTVAL